jgi:hypothetical protein
MPKMNARKGKLSTHASPPKPSQDRELEHFVLWARDGGRIAEIEIPSFRPRVEVLLWEGRSFLWHEKTRRYVEAVSFVVKNVVTKKPNKRQSQVAENSFQFDSGERDA